MRNQQANTAIPQFTKLRRFCDIENGLMISMFELKFLRPTTFGLYKCNKYSKISVCVQTPIDRSL